MADPFVFTSGKPFQEKPYTCAICRDNGWLEITWCDGSGELTDTGKRYPKMPHGWCGRSQAHRPHSFTPGRCDCQKARKAAWDLSHGEREDMPKPKRRYA